MVHKDTEGIRQWYNLIAPQFAARYEGLDGWYYRVFEEDVVMGLAPFRGKRVLDLGTGNGRFADRVCREAALSIGVDISEELLKLTRRAGGPGLPCFLRMDASLLGFRAASLDVVVSLGMFEYVRDPRPFLAEVRRVLVDGGRFIFTYHQVRSHERVRAEDPRGLYYGYTVAERERLWKKARHTAAEFRGYLEESGFRHVCARPVFFALPTRLFSVAKRLAGRDGGRWWLALPLLAAARVAEGGLGALESRWPRRDSGNTIVLAQRR